MYSMVYSETHVWKTPLKRTKSGRMKNISFPYESIKFLSYYYHIHDWKQFVHPIIHCQWIAFYGKKRISKTTCSKAGRIYRRIQKKIKIFASSVYLSHLLMSLWIYEETMNATTLSINILMILLLDDDWSV